MKHRLTDHAQRRMAQRGFSPQDLELIIGTGTTMRPGLHVLRNRDVEREIRECKRRIQTLERLRGCAAVVEGEEVVTCYHLFGAAGRRAVRRGSHRQRTRSRKTRR